MKRNLLYVMTLCVILGVVLMISSCEEPKIKDNGISKTEEVKPPLLNQEPPVLEFEETIFDFGKVGPLTAIKKDVKFKNTGKGILEIKEIVVCCGVAASTDKDLYEPNETGILTITFTAPGEIGIFKREKPIIYSNDPVSPEIAFSLTCDVIQKVLWEPEKIKLLLNEENAGCPDLVIKCVDGNKFAITGISSTGNCITADYNPTVKKTEHVLDLKVDMDKLAENIHGEINVKMNHPEGNIAKIYFDVIQKFTLSPKPLYMHRMIENEPKKDTIKIFNNYKEDIEIESTSSKENTIKLIDTKKDGFDYELTIEVTPPKKKDDVIKFVDIFYINLTNGEQLALNCTGYYDY